MIGSAAAIRLPRRRPVTKQHFLWPQQDYGHDVMVHQPSSVTQPGRRLPGAALVLSGEQDALAEEREPTRRQRGERGPGRVAEHRERRRHARRGAHGRGRRTYHRAVALQQKQRIAPVVNSPLQAAARPPWAPTAPANRRNFAHVGEQGPSSRHGHFEADRMAIKAGLRRRTTSHRRTVRQHAHAMTTLILILAWLARAYRKDSHEWRIARAPLSICNSRRSGTRPPRGPDWAPDVSS